MSISTNTLHDSPASAVPQLPYLIDQRYDDVELVDAVRSRFRHGFRIMNRSGAKRAPIDFPAAFDRNHNRNSWSHVIDPDSIVTIEPRPRPVAFDFQSQPADCDRDQICGFFRHEALFVGNSTHDESGFTYETLDLFPHMTDGIECVYVDIFAPTNFVALRIHGRGFHVRIPDLSNRHELTRCTVFELEGPFRTGAFELEDEAKRATEGRDGKIHVVRNERGFDEVHWSLQNPLLNKRYKIYFIADPSRATCDQPRLAIRNGEISERATLLAAAFEKARQEHPNAWIAYRVVWNGNELGEPFVVASGASVGEVDRRLEQLPHELTDGVRIRYLGTRSDTISRR